MENPPDKSGFSEPYKYQRSSVKVRILSGLLAVSVGILILNDIMIASENLGSSASTLINGSIIRKAGFLLLVAFLMIAAFRLTTVAHEIVHKTVLELLGFNARIINMGIGKGRPEVVVPDQYVSIEENIIVLLSPFFVINTIAGFLLTIELISILPILGSIVLIRNTAGASGDLVGAYDDYFLISSGSEIYRPEKDINSLYIYEPKSND